ncbi:MAG: SIMPL domain-containing protein [Actinobacteria bacterium]|nr:SIMPL domain-containing protein [Actinomycetota bacterium]
MKTRLLIAVPALLAVVALSGALSPPEAAVAQQPATSDQDSVTVTGTGTVNAVPDEAQMSFGVESRGRTAQAAMAANATAMEKLVAALRRAGAREIATQWVSVWPVMREEGVIDGYSAQNSVSATIGATRAGELIDAAAEAGANQISGPGLSSSNAEKLYLDALAKAVVDARERAEVLAKAAGRSLGEISSMTESGGSEPPILYREAADAASSTPIVPGQQETMATVSVTFDLR